VTEAAICLSMTANGKPGCSHDGDQGQLCIDLCMYSLFIDDLVHSYGKLPLIPAAPNNNIN
jgi:hypothetical protein